MNSESCSPREKTNLEVQNELNILTLRLRQRRQEETLAEEVIFPKPIADDSNRKKRLPKVRGLYTSFQGRQHESASHSWQALLPILWKYGDALYEEVRSLGNCAPRRHEQKSRRCRLPMVRQARSRNRMTYCVQDGEIGYFEIRDSQTVNEERICHNLTDTRRRDHRCSLHLVSWRYKAVTTMIQLQKDLCTLRA